MRGIARLLLGDEADELLGRLGGDEDWFRLADEARRTGEWCGTTPGRGAVADAVHGAPRTGRIRRPMSAPDFRSR
jgi:predicted nucleic acid-binding Zn ribbon protein